MCHIDRIVSLHWSAQVIRAGAEALAYSPTVVVVLPCCAPHWTVCVDKWITAVAQPVYCNGVNLTP